MFLLLVGALLEQIREDEFLVLGQRHIGHLCVVLLDNVAPSRLLECLSHIDAGADIDYRHLVDLLQVVSHVVCGHFHRTGELDDILWLVVSRSNQLHPEIGQEHP